MPISKTCLFAGLDRIILTLWVGGLWISGYLVASTLFSMLENRQLAGQLAGQVFHIMNYIGLTAGSYLIITTIIRTSHQHFIQYMKEWRIWALLVMLLLVIIATFVLQPMMQELKSQGITKGSLQAAQFGRLHGLSSILFLINSVLGLLLVAIGIHKKSGGQEY